MQSGPTAKIIASGESLDEDVLLFDVFSVILRIQVPADVLADSENRSALRFLSFSAWISPCVVMFIQFDMMLRLPLAYLDRFMTRAVSLTWG